MATASTKTPDATVTETVTEAVTEAVNEIPALAQKSREHLVSHVQKGQKLSLDAAQSWMKAVSALPVIDLPKIPGLPALPGVEAATKYTFDVAEELLNAQRVFALELTNTLIPAKKA